jgi:hypothetical protein
LLRNREWARFASPFGGYHLFSANQRVLNPTIVVITSASVGAIIHFYRPTIQKI